ncbi:TrkH family potassium uptake protein [Marinilabiliaceae bacterium ANBcel2]|nr:TrkH family potassium uptake protein [Marinilabiliaceae bacterium ANBcel2]
MNFRFILNIFGRVLLIVSGFMLLSLIPAFIYNEDTVKGILLSALISVASGLSLYLFTLPNLKKELQVKDSYFTVTFTWIVISIFGSLPYLLTGSIDSVNDALFETVSGFTTTGSSILTDIESLPKSVLLWRSFTHWLGGMGIIVLVVAVLPLLRIGGYNLFKNETSGITYEKLAPKTASTAKRLWGIYVGLTFVLTALLLLGDISFFDAINHAFSTISTGGFSTKNESVGAFSPYIQYVIFIFMFISGANFYLHYHFLQGRFKRVFTNSELRTYSTLVIVAVIFVALLIFNSGGYTIEKAIRDSFFQVISIITTTGFATYDYLQWPVQAWSVIFLLMFSGACVGSTGGGVKIIRHLVAFKNVLLNFKRMLHPNSVIRLKISGEIIDDNKVTNLLSFLFLYLLTFVTGTIVMIFLGEDILTSVGSVAANMGAVGPGIGSVGPASNYAHIHDAGKIVLSFLMVVGRLELTTVFILFTSTFWDN